MRAHWSLVTYDISDAKRLRRVHRLLSKKGIAVQKSVFLFRGTARGLGNLLGLIDEIIDAEHDDIRSYPVAHPARFWSSAKISSALPEVDGMATPKRSWRARFAGMLRRTGTE